MVQTYTNCKTCDEENVVCAGGHPKNQENMDRCSCVCTESGCSDLKTGLFCSPCKDQKAYIAETINCGQIFMQVTEDEDLYLDCNFMWHARLQEPYKNVFIMPGENEPKVTEDSFLRIIGVQMQESGVYQCTTMLQSGVPVSHLVYHVRVLSGSTRTTTVYQPRPTLPDVLDITAPETVFQKTLKINSKVFIAISVPTIVTIMIIAGIGIYICWIKRKSKAPVEEEPV
ncbi:uncharacterized protein LOC142661425 isoform X1 [Rhinoderma darwinii]|uniref:uncharacterized protein LOC142661424 isoform X1 n=2 Tax=Rhinoderma darwinii TaxID=43563 RepID=UPI003F67D373